MSVNYRPVVISYLEDLTTILFNKGYFSYLSTSKEYVDKLTLTIEAEISTKLKKKAPKHFDRFGKNMYYITYRPNRRTTWYIFFTYKNDNYLIEYITNNHVSAHHIRGLK